MGKTENEVIPIENWRNEAVSDEGFLSVIKGSIWTVGRKSDLIIFALLLSATAVGIYLAVMRSGQLDNPGLTARVVQQWAALGANIAVAILGFLIAGFSVFATVTRPELFRILAQFRQSNRRISEFKFVFYNFMYIFAHYIFYLSVCLFIAVLYVPQSPLWYIGQIAHRVQPNIINGWVAGGGALVVSYSAYCLLLLRSFLWNLYQAILFAIFHEERKPQPTP